ncbi:hypothetical protein [Neoroseomonas oryzicola]|uniref:Uncharacterized protein n=1 Tax=Neoroseomonas oryzicola TaxID=535904 RepID=A0A9X9WG07_9PROT|nr:hypothetical protein [Neoroseomonas oryzicola]MBR0659267.1 hypothetical protein [Neoroseomonas oryzicola]NKE15599.1 hypothetical protein [Neoroseomonas oryzicola]
MSDPSNAPIPVAPPTAPPPVGTRLIGFFLLAGTMWIAGLLALFRAVMAVVPT